MFLASPSPPLFQIYQMSTDGSSLEQIYESDNFVSEQRELTEIQAGVVEEFSWEFVRERFRGSHQEILQRMERRGKSFMRLFRYVLGARTASEEPCTVDSSSLGRNADREDIFRGIVGEIRGQTLTANTRVPSRDDSQLYVPLNATLQGHIMTLFDKRRQPPGANHCKLLECHHLCVVRPEGAVCMCDSHYKLMGDRRTCCSRTDWQCRDRDYEDPEHESTVRCYGLIRILLLHASYLAAVIFSWITGVACYFLGRRRRL